MDIRKVKKLIELIEESGIAEIEIKEGEESVRISRGAVIAPQPIAAVAPPVSEVAAIDDPQAIPAQGTVVTAPMVGTFYAAQSPDSPPFVEIGSSVGAGDTICIIEAMKIMNPIEAELDGTIVAIMAENGQPVEFEQPLFVID